MRSRMILWSVLPAATAWLAAAVVLARYGARLPGVEGRHDAVIVAGAGVGRHGELSPALRRRVERGVDLWRSGVAPVLVPTGGDDRHGQNAARAAAGEAARLGVPPGVLVVEDRSRSTWENALLTKRLMPEGEDVVVVTDTYHALRCERVFARHFRVVAVSATVPAGPVLVRQALREAAAVAWYAIRRRL